MYLPAEISFFRTVLLGMSITKSLGSKQNVWINTDNTKSCFRSKMKTLDKGYSLLMFRTSFINLTGINMSYSSPGYGLIN